MANEDEGVSQERAPIAEAPFDFARHRRIAVDQYAEVRGLYGQCSLAVRAVLKEALRVEQIRVNSVDGRGKTAKSFGEKAEKRDKDDANKPKYSEPLKEITDLAGVRVVVFLLNQVDVVRTLVEREFEVLSQEEVRQESGYRGLHILVMFDDKRYGLPEYRLYKGRIIEIQIRTVLQHAWSEIEHGIAYKSIAPVASAIRAQLRDLAGALGTADRGLQDVSTQTERDQLSGGD